MTTDNTDTKTKTNRMRHRQLPRLCGRDACVEDEYDDEDDVDETYECDEYDEYEDDG